MKVIDEILNEWSFRCHDGIVDLNDPKKLCILKEILKEDVEDNILDLLFNKDEPTKEKILKYLKDLNSNSPEEVEKIEKEINSAIEDEIKKEVTPKSFKIIHDEIEPYLLNKGLPEDKILTIIAKFAKEDEEEDLIKYYKQNHKFDINTKLSILDIPKQDLNPETVDSVYELMRGSSGTKGVGKEEYFLVAFYNNVEKRKEGDLTIDGEDYEVKGVGAIVSNLSRGSSDDVKPYLNIFIKNLISQSKEKKLISSENTSLEKIFLSILNKSKTLWPDRIDLMYNDYVKAIKSTNNKVSNEDINEVFISNLQNELEKIYGTINIFNTVKGNSFFVETFKKTIAKTLIDGLNKNEKYIFVSPSGTIKVIKDNEDLKKAIDSGEIKITSLSDAIPRLTAK